MQYFTDFSHAGNFEVFHSVLKYFPKRLHFSFQGMIALTELVILHFNQAIKCKHGLTRGRVPRYRLQYSNMHLRGIGFQDIDFNIRNYQKIML